MDNTEHNLGTIGKRAVLDELRRAFDKQEVANHALDSKLSNILNASALIIAIAGGIQIAALRDTLGFWVFGLMLVIGLLYVRLLIVVMVALRPKTNLFPISKDWDELNQKFFGEPEDKVLSQLIHDHLIFMQRNREINDEKSAALKNATVLFSAILLVLIAGIGIGSLK